MTILICLTEKRKKQAEENKMEIEKSKQLTKKINKSS